MNWLSRASKELWPVHDVIQFCGTEQKRPLRIAPGGLNSVGAMVTAARIADPIFGALLASWKRLRSESKTAKLGLAAFSSVLHGYACSGSGADLTVFSQPNF